MARSLFSDLLLDRRGNALSNITVTVYDEGTTTPVSDTIFSTRTGVGTLANPFTASGGEVRFWLDVDAERVDVKYSGAAITTKTVTLDGVSPDDLGGGGVSDHGALTGLADDDHPQYETSAEVQAKVDTHVNDGSDAHDASAISFAPAGTIVATNVQAAVEEAASEGGGVTEAAVLAVGGLVFPGPLVVGEYYIPTWSTAVATLQLSGEDLRIYPFYLPPCNIDRIAIEVTTLQASSVVRLGFYADNGSGEPSTLLLDGGTVSSATTGVKELTVAHTHAGGLFWVAISVQGVGAAPAVLLRSHTLVSMFSRQMADTLAGLFVSARSGYYRTPVTGVFPDPAAPTHNAGANAPRIAFRIAA